MRRIGSLLGGALALLLVACTEGDTIVQPEGAQNLGVSVSGTGRAVGAPDVVILQLGIEVERTTVAAARDQAARSQQAVIDSLKANGVAEKEIQTVQFSIQPQYDYGVGRGPVLRGYRVSNLVRAKLRDVAAAGKAIDGAAAAAGNDVVVRGISFTIDDPSKLQAQAREAAVKEAKAKAQALADHAGAKLGRLLSISEGGALPQPRVLEAPATGLGEVETPIVGGELEVVVVVNALYALE